MGTTSGSESLGRWFKPSCLLLFFSSTFLFTRGTGSSLAVFCSFFVNLFVHSSHGSPRCRSQIFHPNSFAPSSSLPFAPFDTHTMATHGARQLQAAAAAAVRAPSVSYTHLRAHETDSYLVCRLLLEKKKK